MDLLGYTCIHMVHVWMFQCALRPYDFNLQLNVDTSFEGVYIAVAHVWYIPVRNYGHYFCFVFVCLYHNLELISTSLPTLHRVGYIALIFAWGRHGLQNSATNRRKIPPISTAVCMILDAFLIRNDVSHSTVEVGNAWLSRSWVQLYVWITGYARSAKTRYLRRGGRSVT